jgi:hypothetical protein
LVLVLSFGIGYVTVEHPCRRMFLSHMAIVLLSGQPQSFGNLILVLVENWIGLACALAVSHCVFPRYARTELRLSLSKLLCQAAASTRLLLQGVAPQHRFCSSATTLAEQLRALDGDIRRVLLELDALAGTASWEIGWFTAPFPHAAVGQLLAHARVLHLHLMVMGTVLQQGVSDEVYQHLVSPLLPALTVLGTHFAHQYLSLAMYLAHEHALPSALFHDAIHSLPPTNAGPGPSSDVWLTSEGTEPNEDEDAEYLHVLGQVEFDFNRARLDLFNRPELGLSVVSRIQELAGVNAFLLSLRVRPLWG